VHHNYRVSRIVMKLQDFPEPTQEELKRIKEYLWSGGGCAEGWCPPVIDLGPEDYRFVEKGTEDELKPPTGMVALPEVSVDKGAGD
jgi:hypothetical protein